MMRPALQAERPKACRRCCIGGTDDGGGGWSATACSGWSGIRAFRDSKCRHEQAVTSGRRPPGRGRQAGGSTGAAVRAEVSFSSSSKMALYVAFRALRPHTDS